MVHGFSEAEEGFTQAVLKDFEGTSKLDRSGSCAVVTLFVNDGCYIANVGDSRAILSSNEGSAVTALSSDHRPNDPSEYERVTGSGGTVYR